MKEYKTPLTISAVIVALFIIGYCFLAYFLMGGGQPSSLGADLISLDLQLEVSVDRIRTSEIKPDIRCDLLGENCVNHGEMVKYNYVTENEVSPYQGDTVLTPDVKLKYATRELKENVSKRDYNKITFDLPDGKEATVFFVGTQFAKEISTGKWLNVETGTTTIDAFDEQTKVSFLGKLLGQKAYADSETFYPDPNAETSTVDGYVGMRHDDWATCQGATTGSASDDTQTDYLVTAVRLNNAEAENYLIFRGFYYFNTGAVIGATDTIDSATFSLYVYGVSDGDNDGDDWINVVQVQGDNVGSDTALATADYDQCGDAIDDPTEGSTRKDLTTDFTTDAYNNWILNAGAIDPDTGWIARSGESKPGTAGITYLGTREGHDALDNAYTVDATYNWIQVRLAEYAGTDYDPKLVVVYTPAAAAGGAYDQTSFKRIDW